MIKVNNRIYILSLIVILVMGFTTTGLSAPKQPDIILFGTHTVGTGGHRLVSMVAETIIEKSGIKVIIGRAVYEDIVKIGCDGMGGPKAR